MTRFNSELFRQEVINIVSQIPRGRVPSMSFQIKPFRVIGS